MLEGRLRSFPVDRLPGELLEKAKRAGFARRPDRRVLLGHRGRGRRAPRRRWACAPPTSGWTPAPASSRRRRPTSTAPGRITARREPTDRPKAIVLGSGPNRIGQGVEFDCCCVQAVEAIRASGVEAILINCNPETVSTDFDTSDRLYFEPLTYEHVKAVVDREAAGGKLLGVFAQFGGQTPLKLAGAPARRRGEAAGHAAQRHPRRRGPRALRPGPQATGHPGRRPGAWPPATSRPRTSPSAWPTP